MAQGGGFLSPSWKASKDSSSEDESDKEEDEESFKKSSMKHYEVFVSNCTNAYTVKVTFQDQMDGTEKLGGLVRPHMKESIKFGRKDESRKMDINIQVVLSDEQELEQGQTVMEEVENKAGLIFTDEMEVVYAKKEPFIRNWWKSLDGQDWNPHHSRDDGGHILRRATSNVSLNSTSTTMLPGGNKCLICSESKQQRKKEKI